MKKLYSLIKTCMSNDMSLIKIKTKSKLAGLLIPLAVIIYLMIVMFISANSLFEKISPLHLQIILLSIIAFFISMMTMWEGIYKTGPILFNCKDDSILLSLPIKKRTVLFVRVFKFYVFELMFNSLFLLPFMVAYIRWAENLTWTYFLTSFVMLLMIPVIPVVISCFLGAFISSISSRFKHKNLVQIITSIICLLGILFLSYNSESLLDFFIKNATSISNVITKIYYPAGIYAKLVMDFNFLDLLMFIFINIVIFVISIFIISKFYFKINSRLKKVTSNKKVNVRNIKIKDKSIYYSLMKKEWTTFFNTPVFIINSGFALVLFIVFAIIVSCRFDGVVSLITSQEAINISSELIMNNTSILILALISCTAFMTSITSSVISLEGKSINILKTLPIKIKTILMSKVYAFLIITTPVLVIGDFILFIRFKTKLIEAILLIILSILIPLISHFIGLIINLKYPKLDAENSTEIVKQSASATISVAIGMVMLLVTAPIIYHMIFKFNALSILVIFTIVYLCIDIFLYLYLTTKGVKDFNNISI